MRRLAFAGIAASVTVLGASTMSTAQEHVLPVTDIGVMNNGEGRARLLFRIRGLEGVGPVLVFSARLEVPLVLPVRPELREFQVHPVLSPWVAGIVDWRTGWITPGGDIDPDVYARGEIGRDQTAAWLRIDVSTLVSEVMEQGRTTHGFLVTVPPYGGVGIESADLVRLGNLAQTRVVVDYRTLPAWPPGAIRYAQ